MTICLTDTGSVLFVFTIIWYIVDLQKRMRSQAKEKRCLRKMRIKAELEFETVQLFQARSAGANLQWCLQIYPIILSYICLFQSYDKKKHFKEFIEKNVKQQLFSLLSRLHQISLSSIDPTEMGKLCTDFAELLKNLSDYSVFL